MNSDTTKYQDSKDINVIVQNNKLALIINSDSTKLDADSLTWSLNGTRVTKKSLTCEVDIKNKGKQKVAVEITKMDKKIKLTLNIIIYEKPVIEFSTDSYNGSFGFDKKENNQIACTYKTIKIDGNDYYIPYVSTHTGNSINLLLDCKISKKAEKDKGFFVKIKSVNDLIYFPELKDKYLANDLGKNTPLTITAGKDVGIDTIRITDNTNSVIGKAIVYVGVNDPPINLLPIYIVTDSKNGIDINEMSNQLNDNSYNQVFKQWKVLPALTWDISKNIQWETQKDKYFPNGSRALSTLINIYEQDSLKAIGTNDYVVFITDLEYKDDDKGTSLAGRAIAINGHYLIICRPATKVTFTHELGHCLGLHHIDVEDFKQESDCSINKFADRTSTHNFMSYASIKNMFWFFQWRFLNKDKF